MQKIIYITLFYSMFLKMINQCFLCRLFFIVFLSSSINPFLELRLFIWSVLNSVNVNLSGQVASNLIESKCIDKHEKSLVRQSLDYVHISICVQSSFQERGRGYMISDFIFKKRSSFYDSDISFRPSVRGRTMHTAQ